MLHGKIPGPCQKPTPCLLMPSYFVSPFCLPFLPLLRLSPLPAAVPLGPGGAFPSGQRVCPFFYIFPVGATFLAARRIPLLKREHPLSKTAVPARICPLFRPARAKQGGFCWDSPYSFIFPFIYCGLDKLSLLLWFNYTKRENMLFFLWLFSVLVI